MNLYFIRPELKFIDIIDENAHNTGKHIIYPGNYRDRDNRETVDMQFGFLKIVLSKPSEVTGGIDIGP